MKCGDCWTWMGDWDSHTDFVIVLGVCLHFPELLMREEMSKRLGWCVDPNTYWGASTSGKYSGVIASFGHIKIISPTCGICQMGWLWERIERGVRKCLTSRVPLPILECRQLVGWAGPFTQCPIGWGTDSPFGPFSTHWHYSFTTFKTSPKTKIPK